MNPYRITVIYAVHEQNEASAFPKQTIPSDQLQLLRIREEDSSQPHRRSLEAMREAKGTFTILLDEGDLFPESFLEELARSLEHSKDAFAAPVQIFRHIENPTSVFSLSLTEDTRIDTRTAPDFFPTELPGLLLRTASVQPLLASCLDSVEPEKLLLLKLLEHAPAFWVRTSCTLQYDWPRESDYQYDLRCFSRSWYYDSLTDFLLPLLSNAANPEGPATLNRAASRTDTAAEPDFDKPAEAADQTGSAKTRKIEHSVPQLLQNLALYLLLCRFNANINNRNKGIIPRAEVLSYMELFSDALQFVSVRSILSGFLTLGEQKPLQLLMLRLKKRDYSYYPKPVVQEGSLQLLCDDVLFAPQSKLEARLNLIDYKNGRLEIDGSIPDYYSSGELDCFACLGEQKYPLRWNSRYSLTKCFGVTYTKAKTFHVSIPLLPPEAEQLLQFRFRFGREEFVAPFAFPAHTSRFSKEFTYAYWRFGAYLAHWTKRGIRIVRARRLYTLYRELHLWKQLWQIKDGKYRDQLPLKVLNFLLRPYFSRQKIWLFFDKIYKGGDSSEYIYKYCAKQKDGIKKYYLLDPAVPDYRRLKNEGYRPLKRGSLKHRLIFLNADMVIASNSTVFAFNDYTFERSFAIRGDVHFDVACVQHGMSIQKIALAQQRLRDNTQLYFCASKYEIENLSKPIYDYQGYDILKLTGVPRYDGLHDRKKKTILLSPTWRMNSALPVSRNEGVARDYNPHFQQTDYFRIYNGLINDPRLLAAAQKYGYRIQYVLHPIVSPQAEDFTRNDFVEIIPATGEMSYEKLFCEAALMVTDFSGVQFDFAYMRKPVVYLHHKDLPQHYENGTFYYDTMGFGEICHTNDELIDVLCTYMEHDCEMPKQYRDRADDFFAFSDDRNCERIYPIMLEHEQTRGL